MCNRLFVMKPGCVVRQGLWSPVAPAAQLAYDGHGNTSRLHERGTDAAFSTVDRLLAGTGHRLYAAPTRRDDAASAAVAIRGHLRGKDPDRALRALLQLNDDLIAEHGLEMLHAGEPRETR